MPNPDPQARALGSCSNLEEVIESLLGEEVPLLSVGGVSRYLKSLLGGDPYLTRLWVVGEVSSCQRNPTGHLFLTLVDPESGDVLRGVVWQSQTARLSFWPKVGQQVLALGQVGIYSGGSYYRLVIWQLLPAGEGLLAWRFQQLKARLAAEGLFDNQRPLPTLSALPSSALPTPPAGEISAAPSTSATRGCGCCFRQLKCKGKRPLSPLCGPFAGWNGMGGRRCC